MKVDLHAKVRTRDEKAAGTVQRAILDPETSDVTGFVVSTGTLFGRDVIVPREDLERGSREEDAIRLGLTKDELEQMPEFDAAQYGAPPAGWMPPAGFAYPAAGLAWPVGYPYALARTAETKDRSFTLTKGAPVYDRGGEDVGVVDEVRFDAESGRLRGFVLRVGGVLETMFGGGRTLEVDRGLVGRVAEGAVYLNEDKDELGRRVGEAPGRAR